MKLKISELESQLKTIDNTVFNEIGLLLEDKKSDNVRKERLFELLTEGVVSQEVLSCTSEVMDGFFEKFNKRAKGANEGTESINGTLGNKNITVAFHWKNELGKDKVYNPEGTSVYRYGGRIILINIDFCLYRNSFKDNFYRNELERTLMHELNHVFKQLMMGHRYYNGEIMAVAASNINSNDIYKRMLAHILYASSESEQNAMCTELYRLCIQEGEPLGGFKNGVKPTAYQWLENLYKAHDFLIKHKNDPELIKVIKEYSNIEQRDPKSKFEDTFLPKERKEKPFDKGIWNFKKFKQRSDAAIKSFEEKICKALKKAKREMLGETYSMNITLYKNML